MRVNTVLILLGTVALIAVGWFVKPYNIGLTGICWFFGPLMLLLLLVGRVTAAKEPEPDETPDEPKRLIPQQPDQAS